MYSKEPKHSWSCRRVPLENIQLPHNDIKLKSSSQGLTTQVILQHYIRCCGFVFNPLVYHSLLHSVRRHTEYMNHARTNTHKCTENAHWTLVFLSFPKNSIFCVVKYILIKCTRMVDDRRMNVAMNEKLVQEVRCFKYLRSHIVIDRKMDEEVKFRYEQSRKGTWRNKERV